MDTNKRTKPLFFMAVFLPDIIPGMILVTGATGFIGQVLLRHLAESGLPVRILLRPGRIDSRLPLGQNVDAVVCSLSDSAGLSAAMKGVDVVYHLAGSEWRGARADLMNTDVLGTQAICQAAADAQVRRLFFLSHLGADRLSIYHLMKAKAIAEGHIQRSGVPYTILRTGPVFGPNDHFTTSLAQLIRQLPFFIFMPNGGDTLIHPLWVEDLATCLVWALDLPETANQVLSIGGPEFLRFNQVVDEIMRVARLRRIKVPIHTRLLHFGTVWLEDYFHNLPVNVNWADYLGIDRTAGLDTLPTIFHLIPSRFSQRLDYLRILPRSTKSPIKAGA